MKMLRQFNHKHTDCLKNYILFCFKFKFSPKLLCINIIFDSLYNAWANKYAISGQYGSRFAIHFETVIRGFDLYEIVLLEIV